MAAEICPAILTPNADEYRRAMETIVHFCARVHIDVTDGMFAPSKSLALSDIWWPGGMTADLHVMYRWPLDFINEIIALGPQLVIVHAEAEGNIVDISKRLRNHGIELGVALMPQTDPKMLEPGIEHIDHVLIFSGRLGFYGGKADLRQLTKVQMLRTMKPTLEIGWDGGVNDKNLPEILAAGVDVVNVGGYMAHSEHPKAAYESLKALIT